MILIRDIELKMEFTFSFLSGNMKRNIEEEETGVFWAD